MYACMHEAAHLQLMAQHQPLLCPAQIIGVITAIDDLCQIGVRRPGHQRCESEGSLEGTTESFCGCSKTLVQGRPVIDQ